MDALERETLESVVGGRLEPALRHLEDAKTNLNWLRTVGREIELAISDIQALLAR